MKFFSNIKDFFCPEYYPTTRLEMLGKKLGQALYEDQQAITKRFKKAQKEIAKARVEQDYTKNTTPQKFDFKLLSHPSFSCIENHTRYDINFINQTNGLIITLHYLFKTEDSSKEPLVKYYKFFNDFIHGGYGVRFAFQKDSSGSFMFAKDDYKIGALDLSSLHPFNVSRTYL
jgi:hypothetical protein